MERIVAKSISQRAHNLLKKEAILRVHSRFETGMNFKIGEDLIFIGSDKNGELPFAIHLAQTELNKMLKVKINFLKNNFKKELTAPEIILDLSNAILFKNCLSENKKNISSKNLKALYKRILALDIQTGFELNILEFINSKLGKEIQKALTSESKRELENLLLNTIGRGSGLTPAGDDLLVGLLWLDEIVSALSKTFKNSLVDLITEGGLTTDISINYYKAAFDGHYSSFLKILCESLLEDNDKKTLDSIDDILKWGHTSGADILTGLALGLKANFPI